MGSQKHFIVIGLGSFGMALARRLIKNGCRVTGMDELPERLVLLQNQLYEGVIGSGTQREAMQHLPLADANAVCISLGEDITKSLLAALHAKELGARRILVKGVSTEHGKLLKCLGVERVIFPEAEIAEQLADRMTWPNVIDFLQIDPDYSVVEMTVPDSFLGKTLQQLDVRRKFGVWVVGVKDVLTGKLEMIPNAEFKMGVDQILLVIGNKKQLSLLRDAK